MKVDDVAKGLQAGDGRLVRGQPLIDLGLHLAGPTMGVVAAEERLARVAAFSPDLDPVGPGGELGDGGQFRVRCVWNESSLRGKFGDIGANSSVAASAANSLKINKKNVNKSTR
jgi:hypothetical protein